MSPYLIAPTIVPAACRPPPVKTDESVFGTSDGSMGSTRVPPNTRVKSMGSSKTHCQKPSRCQATQYLPVFFTRQGFRVWRKIHALSMVPDEKGGPEISTLKGVSNGSPYTTKRPALGHPLKVQEDRFPGEKSLCHWCATLSKSGNALPPH